MTVRNPRLVGLLVIAAIMLGALFMPWRTGDKLEPSGQTPAETSSTDSGLQWRVGNSQQYQVDIKSSFLMTMPGASAGQTMNLLMAGVLDFRTLHIDSAGVTTGMRFASLSLSIDGASDADVNRALASPFRVRFDKSGRPLAFEFPTALASEHRDILENLVRMFQAVIADGDNWEVEESNASGSYTAKYSRTSPKNVTKKKLHYLPSSPPGSTPEVASTESIRIDPVNDWITDMTLDESVIIRGIGSAPIQVTNHATIRLLPAQSQVAANDWSFAVSSKPESVEDPAAALPAISHEEAQRRLEIYIDELNVSSEVGSSVIHRVRDLLLADNLLPEVLLETLRTEELNDRTRADLYLAFELAGSPASQAALSSVLVDSSWPPQDAMRAIVALGGVAKPTGESLATLWDVASSNLAGTDRKDLPSTAALAIGSLGNTMRESEVADYSTLRADLLASASGAIEPRERAVFLYALGNTADPDPTLKRDVVSYLDDPSPEVRSAAAKTLGRLGTDKVEEELMQRVRQEPNSQARASMVEALASRDDPPSATIEWAQGALRQETDERTRYNIAVLLGNSMENHPHNRAVLQELLASEQSKRIRQKVADMLY